MKKIITAVLLFISFASFGQSGVDSTTINTSTPMAAKQYQFKYLKIDSGLSVRKRFFAKDSAFFSGKTYALTLPASDDSSNQVPNTKWVKQELATVGIGDTAGRWVYAITKNATADSIVYYRGGVRYAIKDSIGTGSFARDTIVAGRGLTGTPLSATKVQLDNDSGYYAGIVRDDTLVLYRYNGDSTEFTLPSGGGSGWGLAGTAITAGQFLGTTNNEPLVFKFNGNERGIISGTNIAFGSFINAGVGNAGFGDDALLSATSNTNYNTALGAISLQVLDNGNNNTAVGYNSLSGIISGKANTAIGAETILATTSSTDSAVAIGYQASAATRQLAFSPHLTTMFLKLDSASGTAPAIAGIDASGNWRKYATPSGGAPSGNYGNLQINRNGVFSTPASDSLTFSSATLAVKGSLTTTGSITASGNVSGNTGLFTNGVRSNNNTNIYWNSGPVILGNTNDITLKNATATAGANVSIGTSAAAASAILDVNSTTKGALLPRMTGAEAEAISSPATGLLIYCTNANGSVITSVGLWNYNGTAWVTAGAKPYKVLVGNLTQTGTAAPTFTIFENTTGTTITAARLSDGVYTLTSSGTPFTANKTQVFLNNGVNNIYSSVYSVATQVTNTSTIGITVWDVSTFLQADDILTNASIEIRIYP